MSREAPIVVWFRHDLRLADNPALREALATGQKVVPLFILDEAGEGQWSLGGASKWWLHHSLSALEESLESCGSGLSLLQGDSESELLGFCETSGAHSVYWNRRYEPSVVARDTKIKKRLASEGIQARSFNGSLLQSPLKIRNKSGSPFKVFTPFWKHIQNLDTREPLPKPQKIPRPRKVPKGCSLADFNLLPKLDWADGFGKEWTPGERGGRTVLREFGAEAVGRYSKDRDQPGVRGVSRLSPHLHFGEVSPNQVWHGLDRKVAQPFLRQIAWREFSHHLLFHFPDTPTDPLRPEFRSFPWKEDPALLAAWQKGQTGYPIVDAGMRELWRTGWMHNRVRMVVASFLVKHLLQPWQAGAEWFWDTLVDADLANNTMGWQWTAGCGADAAPYFRVFNPIAQGERFDAQGNYTRLWVPELRELPDQYLFQPWEAPSEVLGNARVDLGDNYPRPIVEHAKARQRALDAYSQMKDRNP